jgi:hypothetical protein
MRLREVTRELVVLDHSNISVTDIYVYCATRMIAYLSASIASGSNGNVSSAYYLSCGNLSFTSLTISVYSVGTEIDGRIGCAGVEGGCTRVTGVGC